MLTGDKFKPELYLRQPRFTYSVCGPFPKHRDRIQKFKETDNFKYMYKKELDKSDFTHDVANANSKDLSKRTVSDKVLKGKAHEIELNTKYDGYQRGLASMVYKSF